VSKQGDRRIGKGGFSTVTLTRDPLSGEFIAVKHIVSSQERFLLIQEVDSLAKLNHPCVVRIYGWSLPQGSREAEIQMEYAEHRSLKKVLRRVNRGILPSFWDATGIGIIICGLVLGLRFVHSRGIIHRDLKPSNILLAAKGRVLIADFGTSQYVYDDRTPEGVTVQYTAPEMWEEGAKCTTKCDVFTFGLVLYEVFAREPVFDSRAPPFSVIGRLRHRDLPRLPAEAGQFMSELISRCWQDDPSKRPSFDEVFRLFEARHFAIIPGANAIEIQEYCESVVKWEESNPFSS
jgi:serine/threonine protein kinase